MYVRDQDEIQVMQSHHSREMVVMPPLIVCILSLCVFLICGMELDRASSTALIAIYTGYVWYSIEIFSQDAD